MNNDFPEADLTDNVGGQRSKFDVIAAILAICLTDSLKNHIVGKGNFSDAMANHYLSILLYHNLVTVNKDPGGRTYYKSTEKGRQFLHYYREMQILFSRSASAAVGSSKVTEHATSDSEIQAGMTDNPTPERNGAVRILVVDDEKDISSAMQMGLEDNGFRVDTYNDPIAALASYHPGTYDLLIIDVKMPRMGGFELYRRIREVDDRTKVCFLTAFEMYSSEFRRVFPTMDVKHFINKPLSMTELVEQIQELTVRE
jgi:CheY-like chemotaxis protein/predicted transcriptional regulator